MVVGVGVGEREKEREKEGVRRAPGDLGHLVASRFQYKHGRDTLEYETNSDKTARFSEDL